MTVDCRTRMEIEATEEAVRFLTDKPLQISCRNTNTIFNGNDCRAGRMKKACVVGGAGFLGSHVADRLSDAGYAVCIFDRAESKWLRPGQQMIVGDLMNLHQLKGGHRRVRK